MRVLGSCLSLAVAACVTHHFGVGVSRDDWRRRRSDPDPVVDPNREPTGNPWAERDEPGPATVAEDATATPAARILAVALATLAGGWTPLLVWRGTFEETPVVARPVAPPTSP